ncbi:TonB-dependent receptor domain-containing protein [Gilvimarinus sp. F26214L]|uniref:TonB-dependent receptor domain-containing protein n=1 Tax=Gilvimarinus sp. DZF01 TaxID=3461371 RepID=UPI004045D85F
MKLNPIYRGILCCALAMPAAAIAQGGGQAIEEIVVTGSLIRGTPEDAALPVEVHSAADLKASGAPTALEFAKSLTSSGPTAGEAHFFGGATNTGNVQYNLRGIGSDKTLSLFNGRRISQNTSIIPAAAIQRIEVLKDGAAVTYGADATGGVVNFITRDSFEGLEVDSSYKYVDGSDGDYTMSLLGGFGGDDTNVMWAAEWEHRSELSASERDFTTLSYAENPVPWSTLTNLATYVPRGTLPAPYAPSDPSADELEWNHRMGSVADFTQESCEAVGGVFVPDYPSCAYNYIPFYNLVEDNDIYRIYAQVKSAVSDTMDFNLNFAFGRVYTPHAYGSPSQPVIRGPAETTGAAFQLYVPQNNPYAQEFAERTGWADDPLYGLTEGYTPILYRPFAHGGNDTRVQGDNHSMPREIDNKYWHISTGLNGRFDNDVGYDFAVTYNQSVSRYDDPDVVGHRLQEALNGFGGPNCNAVDLDPTAYGTQNPGAAGTDGCLWYNPFASQFAGQPILGLDNPSHVPGDENPHQLNAWLFNDREAEDENYNVTVDFVLDGIAPWELPGGTIGWAAGVQWRNTELRENVPDPLYNGSTPCAWPGQDPRDTDDPAFDGCTPDSPGPFFFFGTNPPDSASQEQRSYFVEANFPLLESLYVSTAARHEWFTGDLDATVYKVSGQWTATDNLSLRGSYGTNYQAPSAEVIPGEVVNGTNSYGVAGGKWLGVQTYTRDDIEPETATVWSFGAIWQSQGFSPDHDVRVILDYFNIETEDELGFLASANDIAAAVFNIDNDSAPNLAQCDHALAGRVQFNGGSCVQGVTTANDFASVRRDYGNGPGQHTAGFDVQLNYGMPFYKGDLSFNLTATKLQKFEFTETTLDGYVLDPGEDRLGYLNFATIASSASELRTNMHVNYAQDIHNFRLGMSFISGVDDERFYSDDGSLDLAFMTPSGYQPGTTEAFGPSDYGMSADDWVVWDFHYTVELPWNATLSASIENLTDEAPPESRQELGYDPRIGNPLMRSFEIGFQKRF